MAFDGFVAAGGLFGMSLVVFDSVVIFSIKMGCCGAVFTMLGRSSSSMIGMGFGFEAQGIGGATGVGTRIVAAVGGFLVALCGFKTEKESRVSSSSKDRRSKGTSALVMGGLMDSEIDFAKRLAEDGESFRVALVTVEDFGGSGALGVPTTFFCSGSFDLACKVVEAEDPGLGAAG